MKRTKRKGALQVMHSWTVVDLGKFYANNRSEFYAHALRRLNDSSRAEEVVQDALIKVLLAAPELVSIEHAKAYMHRTIENLCIDVFRVEGRRPRLLALDEVTAEAETVWATDDDHLASLIAAEDAAVVRNALSLLSPAERAALVMWELENRSTEEIANELGITKSAVRHTVSRARASLRRVLSELVVDEERGLTALDALSKTYKKATDISKKSSKAVLSLLLLFFGYLALGNLSWTNPNLSVISSEEVLSTQNVSEKVLDTAGISAVQDSSQSIAPSSKGAAQEKTKSQQDRLVFPGLNKAGVPLGFTVADDSGSLGSAYFRTRASSEKVTELSSGQIIKTDAGAANIFISQTFSQDSEGLKYSPIVSFGQSGHWIPLVTSVDSTEISRQKGGNYLFTASIAVESVIESPIKIVASAEGRDLAVAPKRVITRVVLNPSKTQVLAQAIYVFESGAEA